MGVHIERTLSDLNTRLSDKFFSKDLLSSPSALGLTGVATLPLNYPPCKLLVLNKLYLWTYSTEAWTFNK